ncbi:PRC-barrel domain-containing protein [Paraburkholderia flava]|uniref:PRC-barrel domain-containing protein n=1 Tax=Paraburkholderia flava TaxID=2547393 RepID=UPI00105EAB1D|nr:PRC-barrel domain-containing protein [Paraburkholderia flava]
MSGGFSRPALRLPVSAAHAALVALLFLVAFALSGCGLFPTQQKPALITDASISPVEPALEPEPASEAEPEQPDTSGHDVPKKPKRPIVRPRKPEPAPAPPAPPAPPPTPAPIITTRAIERNQIRALLDSEVQRRDNKVIGRAVDLIVDASGKPRDMVVNLQGFLGIGDRKVSFPWSVFRFTPGVKGASITLDLPPGKLPPADRPKPAAAMAAPLTGATPVPTPPGQLPLLDTTLERPNGAEVGRVVDVLIDGSAQPQAVVLDVSGMVSTDRRTIAANWSALRFVTKNKAVHALLDLDEAQIKASPVYASDKPIQAVSPVTAAPAPAAASATQPATGSATPAASPAKATR